MNKNDLGYIICQVDGTPILHVSGIVIHGVSQGRKTDLEMHVRPERNGWIKSRVIGDGQDTIRIAANHAYRFKKTTTGVVCSKDGKDEHQIDDKSAEIIACVMEQVHEQVSGKILPHKHKQ